MIEIKNFYCEKAKNMITTDNKNPVFSFYVESDVNNTYIEKAILTIGNHKIEVKDQRSIKYDGPALLPFTEYEAHLEVVDNYNNKSEKTISFSTGFLDSKWSGKWISDSKYVFKDNKISPKPLIFKRKLNLLKKIKKAICYVTALGIYDLFIEDKKVGDRYFAPGFTSYKNHLQYQSYDLTNIISNDSNIHVIVAGGWAVGSFVFTRKNRITADRQALLFEMHIEYVDGTREIICSDEKWEVSSSSPVLEADFYDGETYDSRILFGDIEYHKATLEKIKINPKIECEYGSPVIKHEEFKAIYLSTIDNKHIFDFKQNFAGVISIKIKNGKSGNKIIIKHAEVLKNDGNLNTDFLRSAKATITYICKDGEQVYSPTFTYMGFRYISVEGISLDDFEICAHAIYSDIDQISTFECSNELINKLQSNIIWSSKSNFVDIPTDCPQRDERMGWTGDIAVFASTAYFNFDISRFLDKWLKDLRSEQLKTGGIPNTIPQQGYGFPATMPTMAIEFWGDACLLVPYADYLARGDKSILETMYDSMKKYVDACKFWANFLSFGKDRFIWNTLPVFHFGDWVAPDVANMSDWQSRSKWTATASLANTSNLLSCISEIINKTENIDYYRNLSKNVCIAYLERLTDGNGKLKNEFQTGYVLPIYYKMFNGDALKNACDSLVNLIKKNDYCIGTGFPGTPYILFALCDNGYQDVAYKMLLNTKCPSWLYEVKVGGTTIWERWDGLNENGECEISDDGTGGMISFNHYASGAVGDFLYKRLLGINPSSPGYETIEIKPVLNENIIFAKGSTITPYGKVSSDWKIENNEFIIEIVIPVGATCKLTMPSGDVHNVKSGKYRFSEKINIRSLYENK